MLVLLQTLSWALKSLKNIGVGGHHQKGPLAQVLDMPGREMELSLP